MQKKAFDGIKHSFVIKILSKPELERNFLHLLSSFHETLPVNITLSGERINKCLSSRSKQSKEFCSYDSYSTLY
jgi:hypothetical protein